MIMETGKHCHETLFYNHNGLLAIVGCTIILGLCTGVGNLLVIASVYYFKNLRSISNFFLVSLATADLLVGVVTVPLHSLSAFKWPVVGTTIGQVYDFIVVVSLTASSFSLVAVTYDRHLAIVSSPLQYPSKMTPLKCAVLVSALWTLAFIVGFPIFVTKDIKTRSIYLVVYVTISFLFPLIYLTFVQIQIFKAIKRQLALTGKITLSVGSSKEDNSCGNNQKGNQNMSEKVWVRSTKITCASLKQKEVPVTLNKQNKVELAEDIEENKTGDICGCAVTSSENTNTKNGHVGSTTTTLLCNQSSCTVTERKCPTKVCKWHGLSREVVLKTKQMLKHRKYSITMMIVIGCFAFFWLPDVVLIMIQAAVNDDVCAVIRYEQIFYITMMISLGNSLLNPFIYCTRMEGFRAAFKAILRCKCRRRNNPEV